MHQLPPKYPQLLMAGEEGELTRYLVCFPNNTLDRLTDGMLFPKFTNPTLPSSR